MKTTNRFNIVFFSLLFIISLTSFTYAQSDEDKYIVVLDAGHGGKDSGNTGNGYREKNIALKVVLQIGKALEKVKGIKVIYTRKTDVFIPLHKRADIANKADADLFVSLHCNAHSSQASGTETWVLGEKNTARNFEFAKRENEVIFLEENYEQNYEGFDPSSPESTIAIGIEQEIYIDQSIDLARKIEDAFIKNASRKSRGLKQESLLVIRNTYMPSVLIELGFLTNNKEGKYLSTKKGQTKMANAIRDAILDYKKELDANLGGKFVELQDENPSEGMSTRIIDGVTFKVQIAASSRKLAPKSYNFKNLPQISRIQQGTLYKYFYGETSDYNEAKSLKEEAKQKGYDSCFIVAYKNEKRISVDEALKGTSN